MGEENRCIKTTLFMKVTGGTTERMVEGDSFIQMEMFTRESGRMTRHMGRVYTQGAMDQCIMDNGLKISSTALACRPGPMALAMKGTSKSDTDSTSRVLSMVKASSNGLTKQSTKAILT